MEKEPILKDIYAEINRKRALLGITDKDFSTNKRKKPIKHFTREVIVSSCGGCIFKTPNTL